MGHTSTNILRPVQLHGTVKSNLRGKSQNVTLPVMKRLLSTSISYLAVEQPKQTNCYCLFLLMFHQKREVHCDCDQPRVTTVSQPPCTHQDMSELLLVIFIFINKSYAKGFKWDFSSMHKHALRLMYVNKII